ncbi:MAG: gamma-glutamyl-gamma-aminobutyrate hydrolase family protein [Lachnospiraceae bacterium]|nr:gamma-glutamyl-gamma-aminobutyrate hydrolase family protein [Lachnospiraceae bacterium]
MGKPVVGVMPLWDDEKDSMWMLPGYFDGISQAGGIPVMLPLLADKEELGQLADMCDGFLFTGGHDVSPDIYHEETLGDIVGCCRTRDEMEAVILDKALETDKPVLGICRGIQFINAALGGSLYQDLPSQHPSSIEHHQSPPYDVPIHAVKVEEGSPLYNCLRAKQIYVNSYHHQAIKDVSPHLEVMAYSPDGLAEAVYMPEHRFLWAVQWHPEFSYLSDVNSRRIFKAFVDAMEERQDKETE